MRPDDRGLNPDGTIRKEAALTRIAPEYRPAVQYLQARAGEPENQAIHSLYLAGSVAMGTARPGLSDLDITLVLKAMPAANAQPALSADLGDVIPARYPAIPAVDLVVTSVSDVLAPQHRYSWGFWAHHCCVCIAGPDLGAQIAAYRPSWALSHGLNGDIATYLAQRQAELASPGSRAHYDDLCRRVARKLIRSAFCLVSVADRSWTDDLQVAAARFTQHYPEHRATMIQLLGLARTPGGDPAAVTPMLIGFGDWLAAAYATAPAP